MQNETDVEMRSGLAGFLADLTGDFLWEFGQIGQALLDGVTVVLVGLLIYHHGAVLNAARPVVDAISVPGRASQPVACSLYFGREGLCIVVQPLQPAAT